MAEAYVQVTADTNVSGIPSQIYVVLIKASSQSSDQDHRSNLRHCSSAKTNLRYLESSFDALSEALATQNSCSLHGDHISLKPTRENVGTSRIAVFLFLSCTSCTLRSGSKAVVGSHERGVASKVGVRPNRSRA